MRLEIYYEYDIKDQELFFHFEKVCFCVISDGHGIYVDDNIYGSIL